MSSIKLKSAVRIVELSRMGFSLICHKGYGEGCETLEKQTNLLSVSHILHHEILVHFTLRSWNMFALFPLGYPSLQNYLKHTVITAESGDCFSNIEESAFDLVHFHISRHLRSWAPERVLMNLSQIHYMYILMGLVNMMPDTINQLYTYIILLSLFLMVRLDI